MIKVKLCAFSDEASSDLSGQIAALTRNNIPYMEMRTVNGKNVTTLTIEEAKEIRQILADNGLAVWSIGSPVGKSHIDDPFEKTEELLHHTCQVANALGTDKIRMFSFFEAYDKRDEVMARLQKMVAIAKEYNVGLYHENEKDIYGDVAARVVDIMETVDGLYHIYDPANYLQCGEKADETQRIFAGKIDYYHVKDVIVESGSLVPAGVGDGKIGNILKTINSDKTFTLEPHLSVFEGYSLIDKTVMKHEFEFRTADEAFDAAVTAMKGLLKDAGFEEIGNEFVKKA